MCLKRSKIISYCRIRGYDYFLPRACGYKYYPLSSSFSTQLNEHSWQAISKQALTNTKVLQMKIGKCYKIRNMSQPVTILRLRRVRGTAIRFGISLRKQFEENARFCCLLPCVCIMTMLELLQPVITWKRFKIYPKFGGVTSFVIFTRFDTQRYLFL